MLDSNEISSLVDMEKDLLTHPLDKVEENDYLKDILQSEVFTKSEIEYLKYYFLMKKFLMKKR